MAAGDNRQQWKKKERRQHATAAISKDRVIMIKRESDPFNQLGVWGFTPWNTRILRTQVRSVSSSAGNGSITIEERLFDSTDNRLGFDGGSARSKDSSFGVVGKLNRVLRNLKIVFRGENHQMPRQDSHHS